MLPQGRSKACALFVLLSFLPFHSSFANLPDQKSSTNKNQMNKGWFFGLDAGWVKPSLKNSTSVLNGNSAPAPNNSDLYTVNNPGSTSEVTGYAGYRFIRDTWFVPSTSVAVRYQHINRFTVKGTVQQYSLPTFTNYNYSFNLSSDVLSLQGKADLFQIGFLAPYFGAGIGIATNKFGNYNEQATSGVTARVSPDYANRSYTNATFNIGAGFDFQINRNFSATLAYEYTNLGTVKSGKGEGDSWTGEALQFGLLRAQMVSFSVYYQLT